MTEKTDLDKKLDFIVNLIFDVYCHCDVHHIELLGSKLAQAERLGFNVEPSKTWDYDEEQYLFSKGRKGELE